MVTASARLLATSILLAALPITGWAQDAKTTLNTVAHSMGAENLRTLQYTAAGSIYDEKGHQVVVKSYTRTMDLNASSATTRIVMVSGNPPTEQQPATQTVNPSSPWNTQFDFWITPFGFLKGAAANNPTMETKALFGVTYRVISFTLPGNHRVSGFINGKDQVERIQVTLDDNVAVEGIYHDYVDFGGLKMPSVMIQNRAGALSQILIVKEAKPNG